MTESGDARVSELVVEAGLYVIRYVSAPSIGEAPVVQVEPDWRSSSSLEIVSDPRLRGGFLTGPGSAVVVRSSGEGRLVMTARPRSPGGPVEARLQLEPLVTLPGAVEPDLAASRGKSVPQPSAGVDSGLALTGHLSRRGDVKVGPGQWLGGPRQPLPIEGLQISRLPRGVDLEYQVLVGARPAQWSPWVRAGDYAGTRGRALPLFGVRLRLAGEASARIRAEALFLGAPVVSRTGRQVEFIGVSERDPLVGLSLAIDVAGVADRAEPRRVAPEGAGRVRVFRAGAL